MAYLGRASFATLRSLAHTSIGASYAKIGDPLTDPAVAIMFQNSTNGDVQVSIDGTTDILNLPASTYQLWDIRTNAPGMTDYLFPVGTQFWVQDGATAPTSGTFFIEVLEATWR